MNKPLTSLISKLLPVALFLTLMVAAKAQTPAAASTDTTTASTDTAKTEGPVEGPVAIKYLGAEGEMLSFQVAYQNPEGRKFGIIVKDQDGAQLYQGIFTEKNFYKQFRLPKTERNKVSFIIRNYRDADRSTSFAINVNSRFVEEVAIKKTN